MKDGTEYNSGSDWDDWDGWDLEANTDEGEVNFIIDNIVKRINQLEQNKTKYFGLIWPIYSKKIQIVPDNKNNQYRAEELKEGQRQFYNAMKEIAFSDMWTDFHTLEGFSKQATEIALALDKIGSHDAFNSQQVQTWRQLIEENDRDVALINSNINNKQKYGNAIKDQFKEVSHVPLKHQLGQLQRIITTHTDASNTLSSQHSTILTKIKTIEENHALNHPVVTMEQPLDLRSSSSKLTTNILSNTSSLQQRLDPPLSENINPTRKKELEDASFDSALDKISIQIESLNRRGEEAASQELQTLLKKLTNAKQVYLAIDPPSSKDLLIKDCKQYISELNLNILRTPRGAFSITRALFNIIAAVDRLIDYICGRQPGTTINRYQFFQALSIKTTSESLANNVTNATEKLHSMRL